MTDVARDAGQSRSATGRGSSQLAVRYCAHCGASSLITDVDLETSPRRKTDGAAIVSEVESVCRPLMNWSDSATIIKRGPNLVEQQIRLLCKRCTLPLAYRSDSAPGLLYVIDGALSDDPKAFMTKFKH
ncbi:CENP-V/GFA domain-containing protein [Plasmodiophora brassicae]